MADIETIRRDVAALLDENERITMNLFEMILAGKEPFCLSDHESFILCQSNERTPLWLWCRENMAQSAVETAAGALAARLALNPHLNVDAIPGRSDEILRLAAQKNGLVPQPVMALNAYVCRAARAPVCRGRMVSPEDAHRPAMASLLRQLVEDGEHQTLRDEDAQGFAVAMVGSDKLFLWEDESGEICAMAMIAHQTEKTARINTVVTDRVKRGHGYAGMLVASLCRELLAHGATPMLYADADYPASNRAYQKIGFEKAGEVTQYRFDR